MKEGKAQSSQLIIYPDGTLYHIDLKRADNVPKNLFFVGSASRVDAIAQRFDEVTFENRNASRPEFYIKAGTYKSVPMAAFSCGIGVDNIEIVLNEMHALFEYDHENDTWAQEKPDVNIIRIGTSGTSLEDVAVGALGVSTFSVGLDNLSAYYPVEARDDKTKAIENEFLQNVIGKANPLSYASAASGAMVRALERAAENTGEKENIVKGITTASPGFYAPEGRQVGRIASAFNLEEFMRAIQSFDHEGERIINHEMETSILFRIGHEVLGYNVGAVCLVLDNLATDTVLEKKDADARMKATIDIALEAMVQQAK